MSVATVTSMGDQEQREPELWTVKECAEFAGVAPPTWRSYVKRGHAPSPARRYGRTPVWDAAAVREWQEHRPGQGRKRPAAGGDAQEAAGAPESTTGASEAPAGSQNVVHEPTEPQG